MKLFKTINEVSNIKPQNECVRKGILIVDDSKFARNMMKEILTDLGYFVVGEAGDGLEAIEMTRQKKPAIIFMDVTMPKLDGLGAVQKILELDPDIHIIMCTAMGQKSIIVEAVKIGAKDYVLKPYRKENIMGVLNTHLEKELKIKDNQVIPFKTKLNDSKEDLIRDLDKNTTMNMNQAAEETLADKNFNTLYKEFNSETVKDDFLAYIEAVEATVEFEIVENVFVEMAATTVELKIEEEFIKEEDATEQMELEVLVGEVVATVEMEEQVEEAEAIEELETEEEQVEEIEDKVEIETEEELVKEVEVTTDLETEEELVEEIEAATVEIGTEEELVDEVEATVEAETEEELVQEIEFTAEVKTEEELAEEIEATVEKETVEELVEEVATTLETDVLDSTYYKFIWENRFSIKQEDSDLRTPISERVSFEKTVLVTEDRYGSLLRERLKDVMLLGIIRSYISIGNRFEQNDENLEINTYPSSEGVRVFANSIFEDKFNESKGFAMVDLIKLSNQTSKRTSLVNKDKTSLDSAVMQLIQRKGSRILGQDNYRSY